MHVVGLAMASECAPRPGQS